MTGNRQWTDRDDQVMRFLAQQWCADLTGIQTGLGIGRTRAYDLMTKWRDDFRMIETDHIRPHGRTGDAYTVLWLRPSKVTQYLGWTPTRKWTAERGNIVHKVQVSRARAALCGLDADLWVPERLLWRQAMQSAGIRPGMPQAWVMRAGHLTATAVHRPVHDGRCQAGGRWWSVEVELTLKKPVDRLTHSVLTAWNTRAEGDGLLYLYGTERIGAAVGRAVTNLIAAGKIPPKPQIRVLNLNDTIARRSIDRPATRSAS